jgi:hypothetical protein
MITTSATSKILKKLPIRREENFNNNNTPPFTHTHLSIQRGLKNRENNQKKNPKNKGARRGHLRKENK